jgi:N-methylhydantoinase B
MSVIDPVTVRILWDRLVSIVDQATVAQSRTAFSTVVREANDFACAIMDVQGQTLASSERGLASFVMTQAITLQKLLEYFPLETLELGDVLITNDPWMGTGQVMDITVLEPVFKNGRPIAFAGSVAHSPDLGGMKHWSRADDVFDEGLVIPPLKLQDAGRPNDTLRALLRANSRLPDMTVGDLEAQLAATGLIRDKLVELADEYELVTLADLEEEIYSRSETAMRTAINAIPDGKYAFDLVSDVLEQAEPGDVTEAHIRTVITIDDSNLIADFTGSSPQLRQGNSVWPYTWASAAYALRLILVPYLPNNGGFYRPLTVIAPEGTVVNARRPSPTLSRHIIGHQVCDAVYGALSEVIPDKVLSQGGSTPVWALLVWGDDHKGDPFYRMVMFNGGLGALATKDGEIASFPANPSYTPIEVMETLMPIVFDCKEIIPDSEGAGRFRGGFGQRVSFRALLPISFDLSNGRVRRPPLGMLGGHAGRAGSISLDGTKLSAGANATIPSGGTLVLETPGGGGKYLPKTRDRALVLEDVEKELVAVGRAREIYGVDLRQAEGR